MTHDFSSILYHHCEATSTFPPSLDALTLQQVLEVGGGRDLSE